MKGNKNGKNDCNNKISILCFQQPGLAQTVCLCKYCNVFGLIFINFIFIFLFMKYIKKKLTHNTTDKF